MTITLTAFLLARIAEDEAAVNERTTRLAPPGHELYEQFGDFGDDERWMIEIAAQRLLAECKAKRQIVEEYIELAANPDLEARIEEGVEIAMEHLATVYAAHPDYLEEWRP